MSAKDLTVIFLTVNKVPEKWAEYHRGVLLKAIGDCPLITISKKPINLGTNIIQTEPESATNVYWQMLKGAKMAITPYIAVAEDDTLYCREHFTDFRPPLDTFAYNMTRWGILTWGPPTYYWKNRLSNATLIAPRELAIEALEERFKKYPIGSDRGGGELGNEKIEKRWRVTPRKSVVFNTITPIVYFQHRFALDPLERNQTKRMSMIRSYDIPYWGRSEELVKKFIG